MVDGLSPGVARVAGLFCDRAMLLTRGSLSSVSRVGLACTCSTSFMKSLLYKGLFGRFASDF